MTNQELSSQKQKIDSLFVVASTFTDAEIQSHWAKYICVLASGFLENSVRTLVGQYVNKKTQKPIANFVVGNINTFRNPKMESILQVVGRFDGTWREKLEKNLTSEMSTAVTSIVANKNLIAHGKSVGLTCATMKGYFKDAVKFVELLEKQFQ